MEEIQHKHILCPRVACWAPHPPMFRKVFWPNLIAQSLLGLGCKPCHLPSPTPGSMLRATLPWPHWRFHICLVARGGCGGWWARRQFSHRMAPLVLITYDWTIVPLRCNASGHTFKGLTRTEYQNNYPNSGAVGPLCVSGSVLTNKPV